MKTLPIEELRHRLARVVKGEEPILVTRYGKPVGVLYPLPDPQKLSAETRATPGRKGSGSRADKGLLEKQLALEFEVLGRNLRRG